MSSLFGVKSLILLNLLVKSREKKDEKMRIWQHIVQAKFDSVCVCDFFLQIKDAKTGSTIDIHFVDSSVLNSLVFGLF